MSLGAAGYRVCTFCVMDSSLSTIRFDANGRCNCCSDALQRRSHEWWPNEDGQARLDVMIRRLRAQRGHSKYDAMIGLSGGTDSSYLAHLAVAQFGLKVLAVHVDGGWNSGPAVRNIELMVRRLNIDLQTYVVEWHEMRDVQLAFLRASVYSQDIPQDHLFFSVLYRTAMQQGLKNFLSGVNFSSENIQPSGLAHPYLDTKHIQAIHARFGERPLTSFPFMGLLEFLWHTRVARRLSVYRPLNYLNYNKENAKRELQRAYGWQDYGAKHHESRFTKFYQEIYLHRKFGFDKRRLHLSSLIVSGQLSRDQALEELARPITDPLQESRDVRFIAKKLGISSAELEELIRKPAVSHRDYPNQFAVNSMLMSLRESYRKVQSVSKAG